MFNSEQQEWERPDPNIEPDSDEIFIPEIPWDDDNTPDTDDSDSEDNNEDED